MTEQQLSKLLYAQQGELDAVLMYNLLSAAAKDEADKQTFKTLAAEEGRHASVFYNYTGKKLEPKGTKAKGLVFLYKILGRKKLYPLIAKGEYAAVKKYEPLVADFPEIKSVKDDEKRHGDTVLELLK